MLSRSCCRKNICLALEITKKEMREYHNFR
jgi:hypothetical protein